MEGYVRIQIDSANLRSVVRTLRMERAWNFCGGVLFEGGNIDTNRILNNAAGGNLEDLYAVSPLKEAAEAGSAALNGGRLTRFEKLCDDAVLSYVAGAKYVAFGEGAGDRISGRQGERVHRCAHHHERPHGGAGRGYHPGKAA